MDGLSFGHLGTAAAGSAFEHWTEDGGQILSDASRIVIGDPDNVEDGLFLFPGSITINSHSVLTDVIEIYNPDLGGNWPSIMVNADGSVLWGNGVVATDNKLSRRSSHSMQLDGSLMAVRPNSSFIASDSDTDETMAAYLGVNDWALGGYVNLFAADAAVFDDPWKATVLLGRYSDGYPRFTITADGEEAWGDGASEPDTVLKRQALAGLKLLDGGHFGFMVAVDDTSNNYAILYSDQGNGQGGLEFGASDGGYVDMRAVVGATGIVEIQQHGGGWRLNSPDGTPYNITVTNDGTLDIAAA